MLIRRLLILLPFAAIALRTEAQSLAELGAGRIHLPNGWAVTAPGKSIALGDLPLNIALSPSGRLCAVTNNGVSIQTVQLIDAVNDRLLDSAVMAKSWLGLAFSDDERSL